MARAGNEEHLEIVALDGSIQMRVDEIESGRRAPVPEQARLDMFEFERLPQKRIVE
jgi:hypothetical protein